MATYHVTPDLLVRLQGDHPPPPCSLRACPHGVGSVLSLAGLHRRAPISTWICFICAEQEMKGLYLTSPVWLASPHCNC